MNSKLFTNLVREENEKEKKEIKRSLKTQEFGKLKLYLLLIEFFLGSFIILNVSFGYLGFEKATL